MSKGPTVITISIKVNSINLLSKVMRLINSFIDTVTAYHLDVETSVTVQGPADTEPKQVQLPNRR